MDGWRFVKLTEDDKHAYVGRLYAHDYIRGQRVQCYTGLWMDVETTAGMLRLFF
jgi:hypothetical protein